MSNPINDASALIQRKILLRDFETRLECDAFVIQLIHKNDFVVACVIDNDRVFCHICTVEDLYEHDRICFHFGLDTDLVSKWFIVIRGVDIQLYRSNVNNLELINDKQLISSFTKNMSLQYVARQIVYKLGNADDTSKFFEVSK